MSTCFFFKPYYFSFGTYNTALFKMIMLLQIDVYLSSGKLCEGQVLTYDFYYNIAIINVKSDALLSTAKIRCVDDNLAIDSNTSVLAGANLLLHGDEETGSTRYNLFPGELVIALARHCEAPHEIMASPGFFRYASIKWYYIQHRIVCLCIILLNLWLECLILGKLDSIQICLDSSATFFSRAFFLLKHVSCCLWFSCDDIPHDCKELLFLTTCIVNKVWIFFILGDTRV